jgi:protoheme IX farnesyltransferase
MQRTRRRPLPSGRLTTRAAAWFASAITVGGVAYLAATVNLLTAGLAALTFVSYVCLYTPLKRTTSLNTLIGAVPGALPIVGGWTAAGGSLGAAVAALFGILFLWQLPHFLAIAWLYHDDYRAAGLHLLTIDDPDYRRTTRQAMLYAFALLPVSLLSPAVGSGGWLSLAGAALLGAGFVAAAVAFGRRPTRTSARRLLLASVAYLPALLAVWVVDHRLALALG